MILIFGSSLFGHDHQIELLKRILSEYGKEYVLINPLDYRDVAKVELVYVDGEIQILVEGIWVKPETVYMSRLWRTDCILQAPDGCNYPGLYRQKVESFLKELRFVMRGARWLPGKFESIELAESKIPMLAIASSCGLTVPKLTANTFGNPPHEATYRKSLGAPFTVTFDAIDKNESAVTIFNCRKESAEEIPGLPWQWQSFADQIIAQVRCVVVNGQVRSYLADIEQFAGKDLREAQDEGIDIVWKEHNLPDNVTASLLELMGVLGLEISCPEFLVCGNGDYLFIDLNPCGDWYGFLNNEENVRVGEMIVSML